MPVYEYECPKHGVFECVTSIHKRKDKMKCLECNTICEQIISQTLPPVLHGQGFHSNDYRAPYKGT